MKTMVQSTLGLDTFLSHRPTPPHPTPIPPFCASVAGEIGALPLLGGSRAPRKRPRAEGQERLWQYLFLTARVGRWG
ncbi:hypothetical protein AALO_G00003100 [Alosa alosa]|uniref:Uncharacterized protein n=1 Tax=Alosa alosa TaxID=278164 RepID=A0AAV6HDG7_9TELE|nr:hypothetical protein AALO_G00003100 [Alosa alosa]